MIKKEVLKTIINVNQAASKDATRPHICGVNIKRKNDKVIVEATNGHLLVQAFLTDIEMPIGFISSENIKFIEAYYKAAPKYALDVELDLKKYLETDIRFPNTDIFVPKMDEDRTAAKAIGFNPEYINTIFKAMGKPKGGFKVEIPSDSLSPMLILKDEFKAVLMPMRI